MKPRYGLLIAGAIVFVLLIGAFAAPVGARTTLAEAKAASTAPVTAVVVASGSDDPVTNADFNSGEHFGPFEGTRAAIPGKIEAENYDIGGNGFAWFDRTKGNQGGAFRQDDVDIEKGATGNVVAFVKSSEWMIYSVNIAEAGTYKATIHASSPWADRQVWIWLDDAVLKAQVKVPDTKSFNTYADASAEFTLPKGLHYLKFEFEKDSQNLDYVTFEKVA